MVAAAVTLFLFVSQAIILLVSGRAATSSSSPQLSSLTPSAFDVMYPLESDDGSCRSDSTPFDEAYFLLKNNYINRHCVSERTWASWKRECSTQSDAVSALLKKIRDPFAVFMDRSSLTQRMARVDGRRESTGVSLKRVWRVPFCNLLRLSRKRTNIFQTFRNLFTDVVIDSVTDGYQCDNRLVAGSTVLAIGGRSVQTMSNTELMSALQDGDAMMDGTINITLFVPTTDYSSSQLSGSTGKNNNSTICIALEKFSVSTESTVAFAVCSPLMFADHKLYTRGTTGYLTIGHFSGESVADTIKAINKMRRQFRGEHKTSLRSLIIDLRGNRGGSMLAAVDLAALFLPYGTRIVQLVSNGTTTIHRSLNDGADITTPILILIDANTASASEVFTAALCENGRASSAGRDQCTTGKNVVQMITSLNDSSGICFTIQEWRSPSGRDMSRGLTPTYVLPFTCAHESPNGHNSAAIPFSLYWLDHEKQWAWRENISAVHPLQRFRMNH